MSMKNIRFVTVIHILDRHWQTMLKISLSLTFCYAVMTCDLSILQLSSNPYYTY